MTYDQWFRSQQGIAYESMYVFAEAAWDNQQVKIDKLTEECESLKTLCNQMAQALINSDARLYHSEKTLAEWKTLLTR